MKPFNDVKIGRVKKIRKIKKIFKFPLDLSLIQTFFDKMAQECQVGQERYILVI